jgi:DNA-binding transcriptional regulator YdaS (Cro superfamily)
MMQGVTLFQLADVVGVSQYKAAAVLGLARTQTNLWAQGRRPVPDAHLPKLLELIGQAADAKLAKLDTEPPSLREDFTQERTQLKATILALCKDVRMELLESAGAGPTAMVAGSLAALSKYTGMNAEELRKGNTPAELVEKASRLYEAAKLLRRLQPLEQVLDRENSASGSSST